MFKMKFKRYKIQHTSPPFSEEYSNHEFIDPDYADEYNPYLNEYHHDTPYLQGCECLFCNSPISGAHLIIITKNSEYYLHPSCILSAFTLMLNGIHLLVTSFFSRKQREQ